MVGVFYVRYWMKRKQQFLAFFCVTVHRSDCKQILFSNSKIGSGYYVQYNGFSMESKSKILSYLVLHSVSCAIPLIRSFFFSCSRDYEAVVVFDGIVPVFVHYA